ncbi:MAG: DUF362 domain-containing protein [Acidobacteriota bacterium]
MIAGREGLTRRGLLKGVLGGTAAGVLGGRAAAAATGRARVVRVESANVFSGEKRDPQVAALMVAKGLMALTGESAAELAWKRFFSPGQRVGLKINLLGRPFVYTAQEVTDAVAAGVISAGVRPADVIVWDRWKDHFAPTVYKLGRGTHGGSIEAGGRYDRARALRSLLGEAPIDTMASERTDVTLSLPVLKDHGISGVTLALKNIAFGCFDHYRSAHDNGCDPFIADAYQHYLRITKVPLIVLDATQGCYDGGPCPRDRARIWHENAIYLATDPVALDVICRRLIMEKRAAARLPDTMRQTRHIETAISRGLGIGDPARIDLVTITV